MSKRKKRPVVRKRITAITLRLTKQERQVFEIQAQKQGLSISTWARMILLQRSVP